MLRWQAPAFFIFKILAMALDLPDLVSFESEDFANKARY